MNANTPVDYSSRYSFSHFCCRVKQGNRLSECGSASIKGNSRTNSKIRYYIIWRCLHLMFSTTNVSDKWNVRGFERMLSYEQYPEEKSRLWLSSFKKIDQPSWRTTRRNYKHYRVHIIQIPTAAPSFMGIWAIRNPLKIHCYTCKSFETCSSQLIYTKLSSHRSLVINMYVITMAWRCIILHEVSVPLWNGFWNS